MSRHEKRYRSEEMSPVTETFPIDWVQDINQNTGAWAQVSRATTFPEAPEEKRGGEPAATRVEPGTCPKTSLVERIVQLVQGRD